MDRRRDRTGIDPGRAPDVADLMLVDMLRHHARTEVHELASRVGLPRERVRARLRRMERTGFIRGYHARTSRVATRVDPAPGPTGDVLAFVRFTGPERPTAAELGRLEGVRHVHSLCSGWDYMVEAAASCFAVDGVLLEHPADIAVLDVADTVRGAAATSRAVPTGNRRAAAALPTA